jgi:hypothetical protein
VTIPVAVGVPTRPRDRAWRCSPLADAGVRGGDAPGPTELLLAQAARANSR